MTDPYADLRGRLGALRPERVRTPAGAQSSVALILAPDAGGWAGLLIERVSRPDDPWSGHVCLPGGRREPGDADRLETALRETREETGVALEREDLLGELSDLTPRTPSYPELGVRPFVFGLRRKPRPSPGPEARACFWVDLAALPASKREETFLIAGRKTRLPAFRIGQHTVWGITYRILASFLKVAG